jgi:hypothetical protein
MRTDLFETDTLIGDQPGIAKMRVNVTKDGNKLYYVTNKRTETQFPQPWADDSRRHGVEKTASVINSVRESHENVNGEKVGDMGSVDASNANGTDKGIYTEYVRQLREAQERVRLEELRQAYLRNMARLEEEKREAEMDAAFWKYWD